MTRRRSVHENDDLTTPVDPSLHLLSMLSQTNSHHSRAVENDYIDNPCRSTSEPPRDKTPVVVFQDEVLLGSSQSSTTLVQTESSSVMYGDVDVTPRTSSSQQQRPHRSQHRHHHHRNNTRHTKITKADLTSERHRRPMPLPGAAARVSSFSLPNNFTTRSSGDVFRSNVPSTTSTTSNNMYLPGGNGAPVIPPRPFSSSTSAVNFAPFRQRTMTDDRLHSRPPPPLPSDSRMPPRPSSTPPPRPPKSAEVVARLGMAPLRDSHSESIMIRHSDWLRLTQVRYTIPYYTICLVFN